MPGCRDCIHRIMSQRAASAGKLDLAPKAECKQHTGYGVIDMILLSCDEHVQAMPIDHQPPEPTPAKQARATGKKSAK